MSGAWADLLGALCSWAIGAVLVVSGILKLGTAEKFQLTVAQFQLPQWTWRDRRFATAFPWVEIGLGLGVVLLPTPWQVIFAVAILALFVAFLVLVIQVARRPVPVSCNCFGGLGDDTVGIRTIVRNGVLVALAVAAVALHRSPASVAADRLATWCYVIPALLALATGGALVAWRAYADKRRRDRLVRTLTFQDADGNELPITEFQDPPTFLVFFSPGCGACHAVVDHFRWWPNLLKDGFDLQPVFIGSPAEFAPQEKFAPLAPHAWYTDQATARSLQVTGTPGAILIDAAHPLGHEQTGGHGPIQDLVLRPTWRADLQRQAAAGTE
ncbi:MauE/DoxX family redox-associated membrane protein [Flexivirga meconopsidis]|uniref:MauE/DoxX family redox-associated membrane protein n=1 Tax=Flexivirga meconopsidis TaxID=2977121 RepID=UPI0022407758|nr:MauE/DoxX family redox-associated membrane protein [Flexivirga meconopsidis]